MYRGDSAVKPDNSPGSTRVNSGERPLYTIDPGAASGYRLLVGADYKAFPGSPVRFEAGCVYSFDFDNSISLLSEIEIKLENIDPAAAPAIPDRPVVTASDCELTVSWEAADGAASYEVWLGTSDNSAFASKYDSDIQDTETVLAGLDNGTVYYVWIKAKNSAGISGFSPAANGKPLGTPGMPALSPGNGQLEATWTTVAGADEYEVYYGTDTPVTLAATTTDNSTVITGLTNGTTYHVRLRAKNANGISDFGPSAGIALGMNPGLYQGAERIGSQNLSEALSWISANAVSGADYYIVLGADVSASSMNLSYGKTVKITLLGFGGEKTITLNANGRMFTVSTGVTLTLDENITLFGRSANNDSLVYVDGGNLIINDGAKITGNNAGNSKGGGIYVSNGTLTMNGGTISDNTSSYYNSGSVYVSSSGTITMNGGTISENIGHAIYVDQGTFTINGGLSAGILPMALLLLSMVESLILMAEQSAGIIVPAALEFIFLAGLL